ncbi:hypothetical protein, partial [Cronobacter dublinensis]|uniref:hypothetical protein n=1 Tax=Cronobacter dublinensis TaxID=413497 RepID=UPI001319E33B
MAAIFSFSAASKPQRQALRGRVKAGTPAASPLLPLRRLPDFFFLPHLLLFMLFLFLFPMLMLLSRCCRQKNGNTTTRRALAPFGSPSVPA